MAGQNQLVLQKAAAVLEAAVPLDCKSCFLHLKVGPPIQLYQTSPSSANHSGAIKESSGTRTQSVTQSLLVSGQDMRYLG